MAAPQELEQFNPISATVEKRSFTLRFRGKDQTKDLVVGEGWTQVDGQWQRRQFVQISRRERHSLTEENFLNVPKRIKRYEGHFADIVPGDIFHSVNPTYFSYWVRRDQVKGLIENS